MRTSKAEQKLMAAIDSWLRNCQATGAMPQTVECYAGVANAFYAFFINSGLYLEDPTFTTIQAYRDDILSRGCSAVTARYHLTVLRGFFDYASSPELGDARFYAANPVSSYLMPNTRKESRRPYDVLLTDEQVMKLWRNHPVKTTHPEYWPRNYAIVILLLTAELRNAELRALAPADLDFENHVIYVEHGKGDKFRAIDFPEIARTAVCQYLKSGIRPAGVPDDAPLFGTCVQKCRAAGTKSDGIWKIGSKQWLSDLVERHVYAVTGVHNIRSHDLRHVGARLDLNGGMRIEELQAKLGHAGVATTQIYSGRVLPRSGRESAGRVREERDLQARRNLSGLSAAG